MAESTSYEATVYTPEQIGELLHLKRSATYQFLSKAYKEQPFKVLRIGSQYRIPKKAFDDWLSGSAKG